MNKNKYYRILKRTDNNGKSVFIVQACESWFELLFSMWYTEYKKQNATLNDAISQIKLLNGWKLVKQKTVYFKKAWKHIKPISDQQPSKTRDIK